MADAASLARALDEGKLDRAVHALLLLLGDPLVDAAGAQTRRFGVLQRAVAQVGDLVAMQRRAAPLSAGLARAETDPAPLSYAQLQMLTLQTLAPRSTAYNIVRAVRVTHAGPLDVAAFRATCDALLARHAVLRTVFTSDASSGEPQQRVLPLARVANSPEIARVLQVSRDVMESDAALAAYVAQATAVPFDLARDAPVRFYAITTSDDDGKWVLTVVLHHIATDPESSGVFWDDFGRFYTSFHQSHGCPQREDQLAQLAEAARARVSYRDFAVWQRQRLQSGLLAPSLQYWIHQLAHDEIPPLDLPYDRAPPQTATSGTRRGSSVVFQSTPELQRAFTSLCGAHGASLFIGLLSVFHLLLSRVANCDDIVIGAPASGRAHDALSGLMGYFVSTLPFRIKVQHDADFATFLCAVKDVVVDGFSHMEIPLQKMLEHVHVDRSSAHNSVFQVMFAWENSSNSSSSNNVSTFETSELTLPHETAKFDLMLSMREARNAAGNIVLEGTLEYPVDVFDRATVERFTQYFLELATQVALAPEGKKLSEIQMIPETERRVMLHEWGAPPVVTETTSESSRFLDECVFQQVQQTPHNVALRFEGQAWTYEQLWRRSTRLAAALQSAQMRSLAGVRIGLFLDRGLENIAAIFGVLQCRAVFVPLDAEFPVDRIQYMLENSQADVVITQRHLVARLEALLAQSPQRDHIRVVVCEDALDQASDADSAVLAEPPVSDPAETIAYILYTSGSTGRPKGVMVTHANLLTTLEWTVREYAVAHDDIFLQSTSSTLDGSLTQLFSPLIAGASALITKKNGLHDLAYLSGLLTAHRVTLCVFVPSYFAMLIDYMGEFPQHVKHVVLAGEAFPMALATKFYDKHARFCERTQTRVSSTCLVNEYGPTEASVTSTFFRFPCELALADGELDKQQSVPIGRGVDDHFLVVLDQHKRLVPVNVPGELYVGGRGVAKGYWNRPDLTEKSFSHEELRWLDESGELADSKAPVRWYKTGDLVKWLPSGQLLFLGRTDSQVKLRGMRIELQEVRNVLLQSAQVKDAEVLVVNQRLVAYVILVASSSSTSSSANIVTLRETVGRRLPVHMVPHEFVLVDQWPRTPNGKLDLRALALIKPTALEKESSSNQQDGDGDDSDRDAEETGGGSTTNVAVAILKQAWREVLDVDDENALTRASFFELGGNSLSAIRVISLVKPHGIALKLESFFRCKTLLEMAAVCAPTLAIDGSPQHKNTVIPLNWKPWTDGPCTTSSEDASTTPLFLVHCADGTVWKMMELARRLPMPVFGLQATHGGSAPGVEALAATYWEEIKAVQRHGPYRIGGFSFGCRIAHEIALLGREEGAAFAPLTLLDGVPFHFGDRRKKSTENDDAARPEVDEDDAETNVTEYVARALGYKPSAQQPQDGAGRADHSRDPERELFDQLVANYTSHCELDHLYRPSAARGKVLEAMPMKLFKTCHWHVDADAYRERGVELEIVPVAGEHLTMLRVPHVESVAQAVAVAHGCC